ncbi:radical SAM/SPASM domain-containing protein [Myroides fluvii]|uniref:radical SAM/SPASM domain-containing protein n=1 Tax=Myroides fluvii TaxID=2572594 RepID=UPI00131ED103|nr:radical SAM protein [Myroides fluvii]
MENRNRRIIFNPAYVLFPDEGRTLLLSKETLRISLYSIPEVFTFIHPLYAVILNFFTGDQNFYKTIKAISDFLNIDEIVVNNFVLNIIDNKEQFFIELDNTIMFFPINCLIDVKEDKTRARLDHNLFNYDKLNLIHKRTVFPVDITLMLTTECATDCIYCYADIRKKIKCDISFEKIVALIYEAKQHNSRSFEIIGGEFLYYPKWKELLVELKKNGYNSFLSTKVPITQKIVNDLKSIDVKDIQISLDSQNNGVLIKTLKVHKNYLNKMKNSLKNIDEAGIKIYIHSIINKYNGQLDDIQEMYSFIKELKNVHSWKLDPAGPSIYLDYEYSEFKPHKEKIVSIYNYLSSLNESWINISGLKVSESQKISYEQKKENFKNRGICSANNSQLFILPDGNVTICEELYWNNHFLIGNVKEQSIQEIWNSTSALVLKSIPQDELKPDSPCKTCEEYEECKLSMKQICWRETVKAYGEDKWYYPDVKCPKAPKPFFDLDF